MAKLSIHTDEETLRRVRLEAARRGMSVSRFVAAVLGEKLGKDDEYARAMQDFFSRRPWLRRPTRKDARHWPTRDEMHERGR